MVRRADRTATLDRLARMADGAPPHDPASTDDPGTAPPFPGDDRATPDIFGFVPPRAAAPLVATPPPPPPRVSRVRGSLGRVGPFVSGVAAVLVALVLYQSLAPRASVLTTTDIDTRVASALASQTPPPAYSQQVFDIIAPSLVLITTGASTLLPDELTQTQDTEPDTTPVPGPTPEPDASSAPARGLGTGVLVTADGQILTALHVVRGASAITLTFIDGSTSPAAILTTDPDSDIAVLVARSLPAVATPAVLGNPDVPIGSDAYAVGNPYGLFASITSGVISGRGRTFQERDGPVLDDLIQFDAAVNPGNSGGPLLDRAGRVLGIVVALLNPTEDDVFIGIGLAVPIDAAGGAGGLPPH